MSDLGEESHPQVFEQETFFLTESEQTQINYKVLDVFKNENSDLYSQACFSVSGFT